MTKEKKAKTTFNKHGSTSYRGKGGEGGILNKVHKSSLKQATDKYDKFPNPNFLNNCNIL